jgi:hypothetical protein
MATSLATVAFFGQGPLHASGTDDLLPVQLELQDHERRKKRAEQQRAAEQNARNPILRSKSPWHFTRKRTKWIDRLPEQSQGLYAFP